MMTSGRSIETLSHQRVTRCLKMMTEHHEPSLLAMYVQYLTVRVLSYDEANTSVQLRWLFEEVIILHVNTSK